MKHTTASCEGFAKFDAYRNECALQPDRAGADSFWLVDDEKAYFIGEACVRHKLNASLLQRGGHTGYGIRRSEWNRGYGTKLLPPALEKAEEPGISPVPVTCDDDNIASARVMEKTAFRLQIRRSFPMTEKKC